MELIHQNHPEGLPYGLQGWPTGTDIGAGVLLQVDHKQNRRPVQLLVFQVGQIQQAAYILPACGLIFKTLNHQRHRFHLNKPLALVTTKDRRLAFHLRLVVGFNGFAFFIQPQLHRAFCHLLQ